MTSEYATLDENREKLIESAGHVFAEVGFQNATVREICARAGMNVAAVNYYFGEKLGLYTEVLRSSLLAEQVDVMNSSMALASDPRAALQALICDWFERMGAGARRAWSTHILAHEMTHPTPALDLVAEAMGANYLRFRAIVGKLIGRDPDDLCTRMCTHSVVGQILHYAHARPMLSRLWPDLNLENHERRHLIAEHIVEFSLAGMESIAYKKEKSAEDSSSS